MTAALNAPSPPGEPQGKPTTSTLGAAFRWAGAGVAHAFITQRNMKIHGAIAVCALIVAAFLGLSPVKWAIIVACIVAVFAAECFNTALEALVDLVTDEYATLARIAKDCAAGAVLICAIGAVVIGLLIYIPAFIDLLSP